MHPLVANLIERLHPFGTPYDSKENELSIPPGCEDGFQVGVTIKESEAVLTLGHGWHEQFVLPQDSEHVELIFMLALTDAARLKVTSRGTFEHMWTLETRVEGQWGRAGTTGLIFVPFWRRKVQRYFRNCYIPVALLVPWIPERFLDGPAT